MLPRVLQSHQYIRDSIFIFKVFLSYNKTSVAIPVILCSVNRALDLYADVSAVNRVFIPVNIIISHGFYNEEILITVGMSQVVEGIRSMCEAAKVCVSEANT